MLALLGLAMLPWKSWRERYGVLSDLRVRGQVYLDPERIRRASGLHRGDDLFDLDLAAVRQRLLREPRIARAEVRRHGLRGVELRVAERQPALVVLRGEPMEIDTAGVLMAPIQPGVVADVPLLAGVDCSRVRPGAKIDAPGVQRGLAWMALLSDNALRLSGEVSEVDVSDPHTTAFVLMNGVHVLAPEWPNGVRPMSGLRVALADLEKKGMRPGTIDVRFKDQVIVRSVEPIAAPPTASPRSDS